MFSFRVHILTNVWELTGSTVKTFSDVAQAHGCSLIHKTRSQHLPCLPHNNNIEVKPLSYRWIRMKIEQRPIAWYTVCRISEAEWTICWSTRLKLSRTWGLYVHWFVMFVMIQESTPRYDRHVFLFSFYVNKVPEFLYFRNEKQMFYGGLKFSNFNCILIYCWM